jgi:hypothetical protein
VTRCQAWGIDGRCGEPATTLVEAMCRHEHHAIRELCAWHTESALRTDLPYCGKCWDVDGHVCPITARILGKIGARGEEGVS